MQRDPICGMMVDEKKTSYKSEHDGRTFYFCSAGCKVTFDKDPHRYGRGQTVSRLAHIWRASFNLGNRL